MNAARRKELRNILSAIHNLRIELEVLQVEEEEYRDNMPENLMNSSRYEQAEDAIDNMKEAFNCLEEAANYIDDATA